MENCQSEIVKQSVFPVQPRREILILVAQWNWRIVYWPHCSAGTNWIKTSSQTSWAPAHHSLHNLEKNGLSEKKWLNKNCTKWRLKFEVETSDIRYYFLMLWEQWVSSVQGNLFCQYFREDLSCLFQPFHLSCWLLFDFFLAPLNSAFGNTMSFFV